MSDTSPIFILGLQRGGTNQMLNALRSHPDTVWPDGEMHEVLRPRPALGADTLRTLAGYLPTALRSGDILNPRQAPGPLRPRDRAWIASELARATARNLPEVRRYKRALAAQGLGPSLLSGRNRMVVKVMNYNIGLATELDRIYPGARFIGLVRDPYGICESMMARGADPAKILPLYRYFGETLLRLEARGLPLKVVRLEDMVTDFRKTVDEVFNLCGLETGVTQGLCLQTKKRITDAQGRVVGTRKVDTFHAFEHANGHMREDVNEMARASLAPEVAGMIQKNCAAIMERFGYLAPKALG
ncbi:sulfotransferase family protein [Salipiger mangrovisoli]|uniref:Sulfotransferase n=1 Tax=Salipiger mangrovisoli TaxID=2865933 RepID=A0ABR9X707_9RHOB|nr:sulfotransferase [Salipiger mangrovisoli]MBE9639284.1 sulfotransferase [Salipiger mangrovisoli]